MFISDIMVVLIMRKRQPIILENKFQLFQLNDQLNSEQSK